MASAESTKVIDSEFAFYGPMGFDVGAIIANFLLAYCAEAGHGNKQEYRQWLLDVEVGLWEGFSAKFLDCWNKATSPGKYTHIPPHIPHIQKQKDKANHLLSLASESKRSHVSSS